MNPPLDQQVIEHVASILKSIRKADGYRTDAGVNEILTEELPQDAPEGQITVAVFDPGEELAFQATTFRKGLLNLTIEGLIPFTNSQVENYRPRAVARAFLADVRRALHRHNRDFPTGITGVAIGPRRIPPRSAESQFISAQLDLRIGFHESHQ